MVEGPNAEPHSFTTVEQRSARQPWNTVFRLKQNTGAPQSGVNKGSRLHAGTTFLHAGLGSVEFARGTS